MVGLLLLIDLVFLVSWQIFDPIHRRLVYDVPYRFEVKKNICSMIDLFQRFSFYFQFNQDIEILPYREECKSRHMSLWFVVLTIYKGLLMVNFVE